jgi:lipopolysaccharide export system protein LptA
MPPSHTWFGGRVAATLLLLVPALVLLPGAARSQLGGTDSTEPINIQSDAGIEWQQNAQIYIARGNATATRGTASIRADTLIAHYREAKGPNTQNNTEIYRIEALGNVVIVRDGRTVVGDRADYDVDQAVGIVHGSALKMTSPTDTVTARDAFEWYDTKQVAVARGNAVAVHNGRTIKGDVLTAYFVKNNTPGAAPGQPPKPPAQPPKPAQPANTPAGSPAAGEDTSKIDRMDAEGHVVVIGADDIGRGDYAVYNAETGICTLLGNVVLTRAKNVLTGEYAVMDLTKNVSRVLPASALPGATRQRVQGLFVKDQPNGQTGPGHSKTTPQPAASATPGKTP